MADAVVNDPAGAAAAGDEAYWGEQVAGWKDSGLSQTRFCKQRGLSRFVFGGWKIRLEGRDSPGQARLVRLRAAQVGGPVSSGALRLWVGGRYSVEVPERFDAGTLSRLLELLEGR
jgi:hypothetical protein